MAAVIKTSLTLLVGLLLSISNCLASNLTSTNLSSGTNISASSSDTQVLFNDNGTIAGDSGLTYNKITQMLTSAQETVSGLTVSSSAKFNFATTFTVPFLNGTKNLVSSAVTNTELGYLSGVTSAIQTQLGTKISALAAIGSSPSANGASISGVTLTLQPASATLGGVVTAGDQTIAGPKTIQKSTSDANNFVTWGNLFSGWGQQLVTNVAGDCTRFDMMNTDASTTAHWLLNACGSSTGASSNKFAMSYFNSSGSVSKVGFLFDVDGSVTFQNALKTLNGGASVSNHTDVTPVGNVGGGEDDLITYAIPAGTLTVNGDYIEFRGFGTFAAATVRVKCYFGAALLFDTGALVFGTTGSWSVIGTVSRTAAATQTASTGGSTSDATVFGAKSTYIEPAETLSGAVTLKCTGTSTVAPANNDIIQKALLVKYFPAN